MKLNLNKRKFPRYRILELQNKELVVKSEEELKIACSGELLPVFCNSESEAITLINRIIQFNDLGE